MLLHAFEGDRLMATDRGVIEQRAYRIWEEEGRPDGKAAEHWRRAEEELTGSDDEQAEMVSAVDGPVANGNNAEQKSDAQSGSTVSKSALGMPPSGTRVSGAKRAGRSAN
jgi:hypothetical protein